MHRRIRRFPSPTLLSPSLSSSYSVPALYGKASTTTVPFVSPLASVASSLSWEAIPYTYYGSVRWGSTTTTEGGVGVHHHPSSSSTSLPTGEGATDTGTVVSSTVTTVTPTVILPVPDGNPTSTTTSHLVDTIVYIKRNELRGLISSLQRISKESSILTFIKTYGVTKSVWNEFLLTYSKQLQDMVKFSLQRSEAITRTLQASTPVPTSTSPPTTSTASVPDDLLNNDSSSSSPSSSPAASLVSVPGSNDNQTIHFIPLPSSYRALVQAANKVNTASSQKLANMEELMKNLTTLVLIEAGILHSTGSDGYTSSSSSSSKETSVLSFDPSEKKEALEKGGDRETIHSVRKDTIVSSGTTTTTTDAASLSSSSSTHRQHHPHSSKLSSKLSTAKARPGSTAAAQVPELASLSSLRELADLRHPHLWYPAARAMRRRIIYHAGPTNSGKTYNALVALKEAFSGVYAGPLRLLALEVFESLNQEGTYCSLMTGQEKRTIPFARHISATVEMVDVERSVDVAVIDEIQMIGDETRGAAWTRAVLGIPAKELHLCGDPAAIPAIKALTDITKDEFIIKEYNRLTAMTPENSSLHGNYGKIEEGDAVVAFSRKDIYSIRKSIERSTNHKCCVVYGSLPPETRSAQARLFNDPNSGYRVLVASDAIGMGLNLNIRRVVFHTMQKFDGTSVGQMVPSMVKQIAGRAGRRNSIYPAGFSTTLNEPDMEYLNTCLATPTTPIEKNGLFPNPEQLISFSALLPFGTPLSHIVESFLAASTLEGPYFMCRGEDFRTMADVLQPYSLPLELRTQLLLAPINLRNMEIKAYYTSFIEQYAKGGPVRLNLQLPLYTMDTADNHGTTNGSGNDGGNNNNNELSTSSNIWAGDIETLEAKAAALDIYVWLAYRLGNYTSFPDVSDALLKRSIVSNLLENGLMRISDDAKELQKRTLRWKHSMDRESYKDDKEDGEDGRLEGTLTNGLRTKLFKKGKELVRSTTSSTGIVRTHRRGNSLFGNLRG